MLILEREIFKKNYIIGKLYKDNEFLCYTLEPEEGNNQENKCILQGIYNCKYHTGKYPDKNCIKSGIEYVWRLDDSQTGRTAILIHNGNYRTNTKGCILVGSNYIESCNMVSNSRTTLKKLYDILPREFTLTIKNKDNKCLESVCWEGHYHLLSLKGYKVSLNIKKQK